MQDLLAHKISYQFICRQEVLHILIYTTSQGSVATPLTRGGIFDDTFIANFLLSLSVSGSESISLSARSVVSSGKAQQN